MSKCECDTANGIVCEEHLARQVRNTAAELIRNLAYVMQNGSGTLHLLQMHWRRFEWAMQEQQEMQKKHEGRETRKVKVV